MDLTSPFGTLSKLATGNDALCSVEKNWIGYENASCITKVAGTH